MDLAVFPFLPALIGFGFSGRLLPQPVIGMARGSWPGRARMEPPRAPAATPGGGQHPWASARLRRGMPVLLSLCRTQ